MMPNVATVVRDLIANGKFIFSSEDVRNMYDLSPAQTWRLLRKMLETGVIVKLWRGFFMLSEDMIINVPIEAIIDSFFSGEHYYVGLSSALVHWKATEKILTTIFVLTPKRTFCGRKIKVRRWEIRFVFLNEKFFFGFIRRPIRGYMFNVSDREKTVLDCLLFVGTYVPFRDVMNAIVSLRPRISCQKLLEYSLRIGKKALIQRLGFLLERVNTCTEILEELRKFVSSRYIYLDPTMDKVEFSRDETWRIIVNIRGL